MADEQRAHQLGQRRAGRRDAGLDHMRLDPVARGRVGLAGQRDFIQIGDLAHGDLAAPHPVDQRAQRAEPLLDARGQRELPAHLQAGPADLQRA